MNTANSVCDVDMSVTVCYTTGSKNVELRTTKAHCSPIFLKSYVNKAAELDQSKWNLC
jgi:hypothetical protein